MYRLSKFLQKHKQRARDVRDILRLYLHRRAALRSNLHSHWIAMQIASMQMATR